MTIAVGLNGRSAITVKLPGKNASDLLLLAGMVTCTVGPALTLWSSDQAGMPIWAALSVVAIQVCGIVAFVRCRRTLHE